MSSARDRGLVGVTRLGTWTAEENDAYQTAHDLINQMIAAYSARLSRASGPEAGVLLAEQRAQLEARRMLGVADQESVRRVLAEYPTLISQLRSDGA
ncbi:hypothetical protein ACFWIA_34370 [Streptomyces sp. NPDC127068]|uniref:hypothetical protein n=1 Tax=Streptomyces sp. NPDC127068 TaxID=3347127 RepID=UPI0036566027